MARLLAFGGDSANAHKRLDEFDSVDLEAVSLAHAWGANGNGHVMRIPPSPCEPSDCGGSVLIWDGERRCILCARPGGIDPMPVARVNGYRPRNASGTL